jgi:hypothetical protein
MFRKNGKDLFFLKRVIVGGFCFDHVKRPAFTRKAYFDVELRQVSDSFSLTALKEMVIFHVEIGEPFDRIPSLHSILHALYHPTMLSLLQNVKRFFYELTAAITVPDLRRIPFMQTNRFKHLQP